MEERLRTLAQERAYLELMREMLALDVEVRDWKLQEALIPDEWYEIEKTVPVRRRRTKVTVDLDADLVKWFRGMGHGYQRRMNAVLRTFMLALVSKHILSVGDTNRVGQPIWGKAAPKRKKEKEEE